MFNNCNSKSMILLTKFSQYVVLFFAFACSMGTITAQKSIPDNIAFGEATKGGLNGQVIRVTTLDAMGPGSLDEAIKTLGPRIVVFEVGGIIDLNKGFLEITEPYLTIAGQTAPAPGITIIRGGIGITTHDVIVKHIRVRPGDAGQAKKSGWEPDGLKTSGGIAYNVIIDHCSFTWAVDENLSATGSREYGPDSTSHKITFSNNIIAEGLDDASHSKGPHSKGSLIHDFCQDIAIVGNLYAHNRQRNPYFKGNTTGVIVNNLLYNSGTWAIELGYEISEWTSSAFEPKPCRLSIVGNILFKGENSREDLPMIAARGDVYSLDNFSFDQEGISYIQTKRKHIIFLSEKPSWPGDFQALPSGEVENYIINNAGARPKERDIIDERIIQDLIDRKGKIIDSQDEVGGYPNYKTAYRKLEIPENNMKEWLLKFTAEVE